MSRPQPTKIPRPKSVNTTKNTYRVSSGTIPRSAADHAKHPGRRGDFPTKLNRNVITIENESNDKAIKVSNCKLKCSTEGKSMEIENIKSILHDKIFDFLNMRKDLNSKQSEFIEIFITMKELQSKLSGMGFYYNLPLGNDIEVLNIGDLSTKDLLDFCTGGTLSPVEPLGDDADFQLKSILADIDVNALSSISQKLFTLCDDLIVKRKGIIDWLDNLVTYKSQESRESLKKQIQEFSQENKAFRCTFNDLKEDFKKDISNIVDYIAKTINQALAIQIRTKELYDICDLEKENAYLKKQIDQYKGHPSKLKLETIEKELKEERCQKMLLKDRLKRADSKCKAANDKVFQLEISIEQYSRQIMNLEKEVGLLHEQNSSIQKDFDKELDKLTDLIKLNSNHLEDIAKSREKLITEKEELEAKLEELSDNYKESMNNMKQELNNSTVKLIEVERKYYVITEERKTLETEVEKLKSQLAEDNVRFSEINKNETMRASIHSEMESLKASLEEERENLAKIKIENEEQKDKIDMQNKLIDNIDQKLKVSVLEQETLKQEMNQRDQIIQRLENDIKTAETLLSESERKLKLSELEFKIDIVKFKEKFGPFDTGDELFLLVTTKIQNYIDLMEESKQKLEKMNDMEQQLYKLTEEYNKVTEVVNESDDVLAMHINKVKELENIIKILKKNIQTKTDELENNNEELNEAKEKIQNLEKHVDSQNKKMSKLERIIIALEEKSSKIMSEKQCCNDKIAILEKILDYEHTSQSKQSLNSNTAIDKILKVLENEINNYGDGKKLSLHSFAKEYFPESTMDHPGDNKFAMNITKKTDEKSKSTCFQDLKPINLKPEPHNTTQFRTSSDYIQRKDSDNKIKLDFDKKMIHLENKKYLRMLNLSGHQYK